MQVFRDEIFGPILAVTTFKDFDEAMQIANDTMYGLGAGLVRLPTVQGVRYRQGVCGQTAITYILPTLPLVVTNNQGLGVKTIR